MSRVGKMPIAVPQGVDVAITADQITVKGSNGTLVRKLNLPASFLIDTSGFFAMLSRDDDRHAAATKIVKGERDNRS